MTVEPTPSPEIENLLAEDRTFPPDPSFTAAANVGADLYTRAAEDPEAFWAELARERLDWFEPFHTTLEWDLPRKDYDTVGGLILSLLGRIPRPGETVFLGRYELAVVDADERRILKVKVKARPPSQPPGPGPLNPSR